LGEHLKKRRRELGLLQREAANRMGIGTETYSNWETGKTEPVAAQFRPVVEFLGYTLRACRAVFGQLYVHCDFRRRYALLPKTSFTMRARPSGVRRAFLWMSIRFSQEQVDVSTTSASPVGTEWTTY
jgi:transcriptional regulator with XRE-family HTH domain